MNAGQCCREKFDPKTLPSAEIMLTSAANSTLWAGPLALGQGLGLLANAPHVVGRRAFVTAQQAAALVAQAAHICVAIPLHAYLNRVALHACSS